MDGTQLDDSDWAERCDYWGSDELKAAGSIRKYRYRESLIIDGHGSNIRVDHDTLLIRAGFTHYPQKSEQFRFFPGDPNLPDRIIILDGSGGISFDALAWMSDQRIGLIQIDWRGRVTFVGGSSNYSADPKLVEFQKSLQNSEKGLDISRRLIKDKITASMDTLNEIISEGENRKILILKLQNFRKRLESPEEAQTLSEIFGIEGAAAAIYFQAWHGLPLRWKGLSTRPIPESWHALGPRGMTWRDGSENARHPINAMLNYAYAILISQVRAHVTAAGYDPGIGIMHGSAKNRIPMVYDLMEPLRPVVDRHVLKFALSHTFTPGDFTISRVGGCRLNPGLARAVVATLAGVKLSVQFPWSPTITARL